MNSNSIVRNNFIYLPSCHSTNDFAMDLVKCGEAKDGLVILTDNQTKGKGQHGNVWEALPGENLTFSVVYKTNFIKVSDQFYLNMLVSLAIHSALSDFLEDVSIKWPNDVICSDKKIGGVLIENTIKGQFLNYSVVGIGININQKVFSNPTAASFFTLINQLFDLEIMLNRLIQQLDFWVPQEGQSNSYDAIQSRFEKLLFRKGQISQFQSDKVFNGVIVGVDQIGRLVIESDGELFYFNTKEVKMIY